MLYPTELPARIRGRGSKISGPTTSTAERAAANHGATGGYLTLPADATLAARRLATARAFRLDAA